MSIASGWSHISLQKLVIGDIRDTLAACLDAVPHGGSGVLGELPGDARLPNFQGLVGEVGEV